MTSPYSYTRPGMVGGSSGGSFDERMAELSKLVGRGIVATEWSVNQLYARYQHHGAHLRHPGGGKAFFLRDALYRSHDGHLADVARQLFSGNVQALYIRYGEQVARKSSADTPVELGNLNRSDSVKVKVGGATVYHRPARQRRMTRAQLNARQRRNRRR